jgi:flavin-dependent dehydrogenase
MGWCRRYLTGKGIGNGSRITHFRGHLIPYSPRRGSVFANRRGLVVGDAAGVTDPITGEGLYHAFRGARLAADAIADTLKTGDRNRLLRYNRDFKRAILDELAVIHRVAPLFYQWPRLIRWCFTIYGSRAGRAYLDIAAGRKTYNAVFREWGRSMIRHSFLS